MKHLKSINELYKKTYMSAASKLSALHPARSDRARKWADKSGIPARFDRDFAHEFRFDNYSRLHGDIFLGKFSITRFEEVEGIYNYGNIDIYFKSDYDNEIVIRFCYSTFTDRIWCGMTLHTIEYNKEGEGKLNEYSKFFVFNNRKDALAFRKYIVEDVAESCKNCDKKLLTFERIPINVLYSTNPSAARD